MKIIKNLLVVVLVLGLSFGGFVGCNNSSNSEEIKEATVYLSQLWSMIDAAIDLPNYNPEVATRWILNVCSEYKTSNQHIRTSVADVAEVFSKSRDPEKTNNKLSEIGESYLKKWTEFDENDPAIKRYWVEKTFMFASEHLEPILNIRSEPELKFFAIVYFAYPALFVDYVPYKLVATPIAEFLEKNDTFFAYSEDPDMNTMLYALIGSDLKDLLSDIKLNTLKEAVE